MAKAKSGRDERLRKVREKLSRTEISSWRGTPTWKPKTGRNVIRILPGVGDMEDFFWQDVGSHFIPGARTVLMCPDFILGEPCPVCKFVDELYAAGDDVSKDLATKLKRRKQFWMNIVDRENEDRGVQIYRPGATVFQAIAALINDPDYGEIYDVEIGQDIIIKRVGTGITTEYQVMVRPNQTPLSNDPKKVDEWLLSAPDLTPVMLTEDPSDDDGIMKNDDGYVVNPVAIAPYDRLAADFSQIDMESAEEEQHEDEKLRSRFKSKRKPKSLGDKALLEEDEVDAPFDDEEDDEADEVEQIIQKRRKASRSRK